MAMRIPPSSFIVLLNTSYRTSTGRSSQTETGPVSRHGFAATDGPRFSRKAAPLLHEYLSGDANDQPSRQGIDFKWISQSARRNS
jgi:hypothetical protein